MKLRSDEIARMNKLLGEIEATRRWAWWKDGVQYVGSCGTTLADALRPLQDELDLYRAKPTMLDPHRMIYLDGNE